jgi:thiamine-phosphate pyrophosphorylase
VSLDLRLVAILDPSILDGRDPVAAAVAAEAGGATAIQLRMKGAPASRLFDAARALLARLSVPLYVNDRADVAWASGAHGVHVGQDDVPARPLRALLPSNIRIGLSVGSPDEARVASSATVEYWSVGPVYRTSSKADAGAPLGPEGFADLARQAPGVPVIGIGGISARNAAAVIRAGAAGVAVISAIFSALDVERAAREIRDAVDAAGAA